MRVYFNEGTGDVSVNEMRPKEKPRKRKRRSRREKTLQAVGRLQLPRGRSAAAILSSPRKINPITSQKECAQRLPSPYVGVLNCLVCLQSFLHALGYRQSGRSYKLRPIAVMTSRQPFKLNEGSLQEERGQATHVGN